MLAEQRLLWDQHTTRFKYPLHIQTSAELKVAARDCWMTVDKQSQQQQQQLTDWQIAYFFYFFFFLVVLFFLCMASLIPVCYSLYTEWPITILLMPFATHKDTQDIQGIMLTFSNSQLNNQLYIFQWGVSLNMSTFPNPVLQQMLQMFLFVALLLQTNPSYLYELWFLQKKRVQIDT